MKTSRGKILLVLSLLWAVILSALGGWWLYLIYRFDEQLPKNNSHGPDIISLIKWEGGTFLILLLFISGTLFYQYVKNQKKGKALQDFFATMSHELKTPLAAVRLQGEVLAEVVQNFSGELEENKTQRVQTLAHRLIEDTQKLKTQMDKILQLARIERGGGFCHEPIDLKRFIFQCRNKWAKHLNITISDNPSPMVIADESALELIFRNIFENTLLHTSQKQAHIEFNQDSEEVTLCYKDGGTFNGDIKKLGTLFYKYASKGSGIGLYLIKQLSKKMNGRFAITGGNPLTFSLTFRIFKRSV